MKISLEWLSNYLPGPLDALAFGEALTHGGLPVEVIENIGDDTVMDVEVTSNRGDCLSHLGVAKELSALLDRPFKDVTAQPAEAGRPAMGSIAVAIDAKELCPHYVARVIKGVKIGPSPAWMVRRLEAVGLRSINNVVDITNYVMFELGQPLHAFDLDKVGGGKIIVRTAREGEKLTSLDGHERKLTAGMLVIADASKPIALAGVMGGQDSEVSAGTVNVLLEAARFEPLSIRKTARALVMKSDSSYRFERSIDPTLPERASLRAAELILQLAGGELLGGSVVAGGPAASPGTPGEGGGEGSASLIELVCKPKKLSLRLSKLKSVLGVEIPKADAINALKRDHLSPVDAGEKIDVTVPSNRLDINIEVDLVEEVARVLGYDRIPIRDEISIRVTPPDPRLAAMEVVRSTLVAAGFFESWTASFVTDALATDFLPAVAKGLPRVDPIVRKADGQLRPSILPGLLEAVRRNENIGTSGARLFETGGAFWLDSTGKVAQVSRVAMVGTTDLRELRGSVEVLLAKLDAHRPVTIVPQPQPGFDPGASGRIEWGGKPIGSIGKIDRKAADKLSLRDIPAAAELDLSKLIAGAQLVPQQSPLPRFPSVRRDLSLVVADSVRYEAIDSIVREVKPQHLEDVEYVTTYRGKPLEKGAKSVTITLVFRSPTGTLTSEQVEGAVQSVVSAAKTKVNATLRV